MRGRGNISSRVLFMLAIFVSVCALSSMAEIELIPGEYDFGLMREEEGTRTGKTLLVNKGNETISIRQVRPSCGCTDSDFYDGEIAPGDTAWVSFTYNPSGRPGAFRKTVRVILNPDGDKEVIVIKGTVLGTDESLDRHYPAVFGKLRLTEPAVLFGELRMGTSRHYFVRGYNQSPDTIYPCLLSGNKELETEVVPSAIPPGEVATLSFYLRAQEIDRPGDKKYIVELIPDSLNPENKYNLEVMARILPARDSIEKKRTTNE